ncbi:MAG TPA: type III pantothenate kinase [Candidatus Methylacidiphilales bacterium]|jgi:type III pantothenate kinase|nr:type III pantothenate kinase [Candidatus Methylacidiphilales bacterium]
MNFHSFLLVDAGNTRVKWTRCDLDAPASVQLNVKGEKATADVTPHFIRKMRKDFAGHYLVLSSVVPKLTADFSLTFKRGFHVLNGGSPHLGFAFDYPKPAEIGADRLAGAAAIHASGKWPAIIVSCGTATAFSVLDARGRFCGGAIAPGLQTQLAALLGATAQLPEVALKPPKSALAKSTPEAIRAGVAFNFAGGAREIIRQLTATLPGWKKPKLFLTGGNAPFLANSLGLAHTLRPLLVFEGLRIIGTRAIRTL